MEVRRLAGEEVTKPDAGTFEALFAEYKSSPEFAELSDASQADYSRYLLIILELWGGLRVLNLKPAHILKLRDSKRDRPASANYMVRVLSAVIAWSIPRGYRDDNPCAHVRKFKTGAGWQPWSWEAIGQFQQVARVHLWWAAALALYTGQRRSDVLSMRWDDIVDGVLAVRQSKTGIRVWIPIHRDLNDILATMPRRSLTVLTNAYGRPWTKEGFKSAWGRAPVPEGLVFHGLRKSAVVFLLEAGCTDAEVAAVTGQSRQMVEHYSRMVNRKRLAAAAVLKWEQNVE